MLFLLPQSNGRGGCHSQQRRRSRLHEDGYGERSGLYCMYLVGVCLVVVYTIGWGFKVMVVWSVFFFPEILTKNCSLSLMICYWCVISWLSDVDFERLYGSLSLFCLMQGNHKGPVRRWDFDNEDDYSTYQSAREAMPKQVTFPDSGRVGEGMRMGKVKECVQLDAVTCSTELLRDVIGQLLLSVASTCTISPCCLPCHSHFWEVIGH